MPEPKGFPSTSSPPRPAPEAALAPTLARQVGVRITSQEHADWSALAAERGLSLPALMRACTNIVAATDRKQEASHA
jgi:hypothetical protein